MRRGRRILVGYDGSEAARRALERAAAIGGSAASVAVVTVARPIVSDLRTGDIVDPSDENERDRLLAEARALLASRGVSAATVGRSGEPAAALVEEAARVGADLLIVGTRGRNRLARTLLGSVSSKVVHEAPCDVLVVR